MIARRDENLYVVVVFRDGMTLAEPARSLLDWPSDILCDSLVSYHPKSRALQMAALGRVAPMKADSRPEGVGGNET